MQTDTSTLVNPNPNPNPDPNPSPNPNQGLSVSLMEAVLVMERSLYDAAWSGADDAPPRRATLLRTQRRMHADIAG